MLVPGDVKQRDRFAENGEIRPFGEIDHRAKPDRGLAAHPEILRRIGNGEPEGFRRSGAGKPKIFEELAHCRAALSGYYCSIRVRHRRATWSRIPAALRIPQQQLPAAFDVFVDPAQFLFGDCVLGRICGQRIESLGDSTPEVRPLCRTVWRLKAQVGSDFTHRGLSLLLFSADLNLRLGAYEFETEQNPFS
jgi:hypothetical protein